MLENGEHRIEHLAVFARIAFDSGERSLGVKILNDLINKYKNNLNFEVTEPVLPVSSKYDSICPNGNIKEWLFSSILEQYISKHHHSTYFTRRTSLPLFKKLRKLGYMDDDMKKKEEMIKNIFSS